MELIRESFLKEVNVEPFFELGVGVWVIARQDDIPVVWTCYKQHVWQEWQIKNGFKELDLIEDLRVWKSTKSCYRLIDKWWFCMVATERELRILNDGLEMVIKKWVQEYFLIAMVRRI